MRLARSLCGTCGRLQNKCALEDIGAPIVLSASSVCLVRFVFSVFLVCSLCLSCSLSFSLFLLLSLSHFARSVSVSLVLAVSCSLGLSRWLCLSSACSPFSLSCSVVCLGGRVLSLRLSLLRVSLLLTLRCAVVIMVDEPPPCCTLQRVPWPVGRGADARMKSSVLCVS